MNKEFLERLYWACTDENDYAADGTKLAELYERIDEASKADKCFDNELNRINISTVDKRALDSIRGSIAMAYEKQGFINGFRLGMKLAGELREEDWE